MKSKITLSDLNAKLKKLKVSGDKRILDEPVIQNYHCRLTFHVYDGVTLHAGSAILLSANGNPVGDVASATDLKGDAQIERTFFLNPVLIAGRNEVRIQTAVISQFDGRRKWTSASIEILADGHTYVRQDYFAPGGSRQPTGRVVDETFVINK